MSDGDGRTGDASPGPDERGGPDGPATGAETGSTDDGSTAAGPDDRIDGAPTSGAGDRAGSGDRPLDPAAVDVSELTGPERSLEPTVRLVWIIRAALVALVLGTVAGALAAVFRGPVWVGPVAFTALFAVGGLHAHLRYASWTYRVRTDSLFLRRGVLTRVRTVVPYVRIQHVDVSRGPAERAFGLATVIVYTAGSRGADVTIPGLTPARADDLQERLKQLAIAAEGEDAV